MKEKGSKELFKVIKSLNSVRVVHGWLWVRGKLKFSFQGVETKLGIITNVSVTSTG